LKNLTIQANFYDEYRIVRDIDEGSFAKVVMAERKSDLKTFAVKVFVKDKISKSETKIKSLKNEIQILRKLNHKLVNKFYEVHENNQNVFLVLEHIKGEQIFDYTKRVKFDLVAIQNVMKTILCALAYLSSIDVMHRD